jgi:hypothetical protein
MKPYAFARIPTRGLIGGAVSLTSNQAYQGETMAKEKMAKAKAVRSDTQPMPRQVTRRENRDRYEGMLAYSTAYSMMNIRRTFNAMNDFYCGTDPLRRQELADGGMVREDQNAMANLPEQAIHCQYPNQYFANLSPYIDDTAIGE